MKVVFTLCIGILLFVSCGEEKLDYQRLIQGNWEYEYVDEYGDSLVLNLYFLDSICHFPGSHDNTTHYVVKDDTIEITYMQQYAIDFPVRKHLFKIVGADKSNLKVVSLSDPMNKKTGLTRLDTLSFVRIKKKSNLDIRRVSFYAGSCSGPCPSFKLEMNVNNSVKYEGFSNAQMDGQYCGKSSPLFWKLMEDKIHYIDFQNWKEDYSAGWTDDRTCSLVFETNKGIYKVSIYGDDKEPRELRNMIIYLFSNYENFDLKKSENVSVTFNHDSILWTMSDFRLEEAPLKFMPPY